MVFVTILQEKMCRLIFVFFILLAQGELVAQDLLSQSPLSLPALIQRVIECNPNLEAARLRVEASAIAVPRVQVLDDPEATIMSEENKFHEGSEFTPMMKYILSQKIPFPGKLRLKGAIAYQELEFLHAEEKTIWWDLVLQTKKLYFRLYFNKLAKEINAQNQNLLSNITRGAMALYQSGKGSYADVLKAQSEEQVLKEELLNLLAERGSIVAMINALLNRSQTEPIGDPEVIQNPKMDFHYEELAEIARQQRPELQGIQAQVEEERLTAALARRNYYPDFTIAAGYEQMNDNFAGHIDNAWTASIGFNIPIRIPQKQRREMREAQTRAAANQNAYCGTLAMIQGQIQEILFKLRYLDERITLYESNLLPKTRETLSASETKYRVGGEEFLLVIDTRRQLQGIELEYERSLVEKEVLLAELERAIGMPLEQFLCK